MIDPLNLVKLKFVLSPELHYMPNDLTFKIQFHEICRVAGGRLEHRACKMSRKLIGNSLRTRRKHALQFNMVNNMTSTMIVQQ